MGACILPSRFSRVQLFVTPWTVARQAPLSMGILQARILEWVAMPSSRGSSRPRDQTHMSYISCIGRRVLYHWRQTGRPQVAGPLVVFRKVLLATVGMVDQREQKWTNWTTVGPWRGEEERIERISGGQMDRLREGVQHAAPILPRTAGSLPRSRCHCGSSRTPGWARSLGRH